MGIWQEMLLVLEVSVCSGILIVLVMRQFDKALSFPTTRKGKQHSINYVRRKGVIEVTEEEADQIIDLLTDLKLQNFTIVKSHKGRRK